MERKELYAKIQQLGLQEEVKKTYGKNYTMVSNDNLKQIIWNYDATLVDKDSDDSETTEPDTVETNKVEDAAEMDNAYEAACLVFLGILKDSGKLDDLLSRL